MASLQAQLDALMKEQGLAFPAPPQGFVLERPPRRQAIPPTPAGFEIEPPPPPPGFEIETTPSGRSAAEPADDRSEFMRGLIGSLIGTNPKLAGDAAEGLGVLIDHPGIQEWGRAISRGGEARIPKARVPSFTDIKSLSDLGSYAGYQAGAALGTTAPSLLVGGAGALMTGGNPLVGLFLGAAGPSYVQNFGDLYGSVRDDPDIQKAISEGKASAKGTAQVAAMAAVPMAALDAFGIQSILGKTVFAEAKQRLVKRIAHGIVTGAITEGTTEGLQEAISQWAQAELGSRSPLAAKAISVIDNAIGGALGGGLLGGGAGTIPGRSAVPRERIEPTIGPNRYGEEGGPAKVTVTGFARPEAPPEPPPAAEAIPADTGILEVAGWTPDQIADMDPAERAAAIQEAQAQGVRAPVRPAAPPPQIAAPASPAPAPGTAPFAPVSPAGPEIAAPVPAGTAPAATSAADRSAPARTAMPDWPTAEPVGDLQAQAADLDNPQSPRRAVWLPAASVQHLQQIGENALQDILDRGVVLRNYDGMGGILVARDAETARAAREARERGMAIEAIVGMLTGAGTGKPADMAAVVQQVDPAGNVTRESGVAPEEIAARAAEMAAPGRTVRIVPPSEALIRRAREIAAETETPRTRRGAPEPGRTRTGKIRRPPSLLEFIADMGGIRDETGELRAMGATAKFLPGRGKLVRPAGLHPDKVREAAAEAGYLGENKERAVAETTMGDLYDAMAEELAGRRRYSVEDYRQAQEYEAQIEEVEARAHARREIERTLEEHGAPTDDRTLIDRAAEIMMRNDLDPDEAIERAAIQLEGETVSPERRRAADKRAPLPGWEEDGDGQTIAREGAGIYPAERARAGAGEERAEAGGQPAADRGAREGAEIEGRAEEIAPLPPTEHIGAGTQPIKLTPPERAKLEKTVIRTVHRIFGRDIDIETPDIIPNLGVGDPRYRAAVDRVKAAGGKIGDTAGGLARVDGRKLWALIRVAIADPGFDPRTSAAHEAYHVVESLLMPAADFAAVRTPKAIRDMRRIVARYLGVADSVVETLPGYELRAIAFEAFDLAREQGKPVMGAVEGLPGVLARFFERLRRFIRALRRALGEQGIRDWRDVFEDVSAGTYATAPVQGFRSLAATGATVQRPQIETPAFQRWFRQSKVVRPDGSIAAPVFETKAEAEAFQRQGSITVPALPITPAMRDSVMQGQPLFRQGRRDAGAVKLSSDERRALEADLRSIVSRIAGRKVQVVFADRMQAADYTDPNYQTEMQRAAEAVGVTLQPTVGGIYQYNDTLPAEGLIRLALADPVYELRQSAAHEAFHHFAFVLATDTERKLLEHQRTRMEDYLIRKGYPEDYARNLPQYEVEAIAFHHYFADRDGKGLHPGLRRLFDKIVEALRQIKALLGKKGYTRFEDMFADVLAGKMAERGERIDGRQGQQSPVGVTPENAARLSFVGARTQRLLDRVGYSADVLSSKIEDRWIWLKRIQEDIEKRTGVPLPESLDAYVAQALSPKMNEELVDLRRRFLEPLIEKMQVAGISVAQLDRYLMAKHAPERNAVILQRDPTNPSGSGMSDASAARILGAIPADKRAAYEELADMVQKLVRETRERLVRAGLISRATAQAWANQYQNYVPLRGFEVDPADEGPRTGRGFDIRGPESRAATGRHSRADSPLAYAIMQAEQAIVRAEKNRVLKTLLRLVQTHPDPDIWAVAQGRAERYIDDRTGMVKERWVHPSRDWNDPELFGVKIGGKTTFIEIKDPRLQRALRGLGGDSYSGLIRAVMRISRVYAQLVTQWSPEFVPTNMFRDVQTALVNISDTENLPKGIRRKMIADALSLRSIRGILAALRDPASRDEYARWFEEYRHAGGKISFANIQDLAAIKRSIEVLLKAGRARRAIMNAARLVEDLNTAVENGIRLSAYKAMREAGISQTRAAYVARNLTVDFNRRGEWSPAINALYLFFNASLQGATRIARAASRSRTVRIAIATIFAAGAGMDFLNWLFAGGDDDDRGNAYDTLPEWVKERNLVVMLGGDDYIKIPLPYGYNVPFVAGRHLAATLRGAETVPKALGNILASALESFNPLGVASSFLQFLSPTLLDPFVQVVENRTWYGGPVHPKKYDDKLPDSELYFKSAPEWAKTVARTLNAATGGNPARPGLVDISPESLELYADFALGGLGRFFVNALSTGERFLRGEDWVPEDFPMVRRLYGQVKREGTFYELWDKIDTARYETMRLAKLGDAEGAARVREANRADLGLYLLFKRTRDQLADLADKSRKAEAEGDRERQKHFDARRQKLIDDALRRYRDAHRR
jgi:hypothetical protein